MEYISTFIEKIKDLGIWYRRYKYYYFDYKEHEMRLANQSRKESVKLAAVKANEIEEIKEKIFTGKWKVDDIVSINNMTTMLHEAVVMDRKDIAIFLLRQGANPNLRDRNGMTPLLKAAALGRQVLVAELIKAGVNPEHRDPHGFTPYEKAVLHEEWETAELLKKYGSYVKSKTEWLWPPDI